MILFNIPPITGRETEALSQVVENKQLSGGKSFSRRCQEWFEDHFDAPRALMTPSCTAALEMSALLIDCHPGDEIIMPSYTFVSTANAFVLRGARIVFVDIDPATMNIDPDAVLHAVTDKTKAIVVVHYAGVGCDMNALDKIAKDNGLFLIEDAAQAIFATYKGRPLGGFGHLSTFSFHETKNITCGEGGMLVINDGTMAKRAEIIQEKGTNRRQFMNGEVDKYSWVDIGSSYLASELQAAWLFTQLEDGINITDKRLVAWNIYHSALSMFVEKYGVFCPVIPEGCQHNAHMYYIKLPNKELRDNLMSYLKSEDIQSVFHYIPLHSSPAGQNFGVFCGDDKYTTHHSECILRLPLHLDIQVSDQKYIIEKLYTFCQENMEKKI